jgi:hypothetical protein
MLNTYLFKVLLKLYISCVYLICTVLSTLSAGHLYTLQHENVTFDKICCNLFYVRVNKTDFLDIKQSETRIACGGHTC